MMTQEEYVSDAVDLLKKLIATPSVSRNEKEAADVMEQTIRKYGFEPHREANNIWMIDPHYDESRPTLLLNAHIPLVVGTVPSVDDGGAGIAFLLVRQFLAWRHSAPPASLWIIVTINKIA